MARNPINAFCHPEDADPERCEEEGTRDPYSSLTVTSRSPSLRSG
ncbi:MAG TPA: hypothetical protein VGO79_03180 [Thermoanaerobaculia bacterium]